MLIKGESSRRRRIRTERETLDLQVWVAAVDNYPVGLVNDGKQTTRASRDLADALAAIVQSSDDAIYSKDPEGLLTSWNPAAQALYGYTPQEAIGQPVSILIPEERKGEEFDILHRVLGGEKVEHYETVRQRKDGSRVEVSVSVSPVHGLDGQIVEASVIARDLTKQRRLEAEAAEAEERHRTLARKQALELNDAVVQGLAAAKMALETTEYEIGLRAISATLKRAQDIVTSLLSEGESLKPGDLVRENPATLE